MGIDSVINTKKPGFFKNRIFGIRDLSQDRVSDILLRQLYPGLRLRVTRLGWCRTPIALPHLLIINLCTSTLQKNMLVA